MALPAPERQAILERLFDLLKPEGQDARALRQSQMILQPFHQQPLDILGAVLVTGMIFAPRAGTPAKIEEKKDAKPAGDAKPE